MPRSRKRPGHQYQKPADIPASQRTKGRIGMAVLLGIFGFFIGYFAFGDWTGPVLTAILAAAAGFLIGKNMEKQARK